MSDEGKWVQIAVRIPQTQLEQIDALLPWIRTQAFGGEANRSTIVREVVSRGLRSLERQRDVEEVRERAEKLRQGVADRLELEVVTMTSPSSTLHVGTWPPPKTLDEALSWADTSLMREDDLGGTE